MNSIYRANKQKTKSDIAMLRAMAESFYLNGTIGGGKKRMLERVADRLEKYVEEESKLDTKQ